MSSSNSRHFSKLQLHRYPTSTLEQMYKNSSFTFAVPFEVIKNERKEELDPAEAAKRAELRAQRRAKNRHQKAGERESKRVLAEKKRQEARAASIEWNEGASSKGRK